MRIIPIGRRVEQNHNRHKQWGFGVFQDDKIKGELKEKHGTNIESWWQENFGHAFDCLTQSEARYLARTSDVDTIRDRIAEAK